MEKGDGKKDKKGGRLDGGKEDENEDNMQMTKKEGD